MSTPAKKIAVICANGLGDGLISLVFAHNLEQHGYQVTTFSNYLTQLKPWFPQKNIQSLPTQENAQAILSAYDKIISTDGASLSKMDLSFSDKYKIYYEHDFDRSKTVLENFLIICQKNFGVTTVTAANGCVVPPELQSRKFLSRVIIHPTSTSETKNWPMVKYLKLAKKLKRKNFTPVFVVSPTERPLWLSFLQDQFALPEFASLNDLANFIYESGYMIGNDSGIGHLAANLGLPTLSLFARKSVANLWRPNWGKGIVVTPTLQLPGARLRTKYWKNFLPVRKVLQQFKLLVNKNGGQ